MSKNPRLKVSKGMHQAKKSAPKIYLIQSIVKKLVPSPRKLLNGQEVQRISELRKF